MWMFKITYSFKEDAGKIPCKNERKPNLTYVTNENNDDNIS